MAGMTFTLLRKAIPALGLILVLPGCAFFSTGASMRVEVEVYKGPLSKDVPLQLGEIFGVIDAGIASFEVFLRAADFYYTLLDCPNKHPSRVYSCITLENMMEPTTKLLNDVKRQLEENEIKELRKLLVQHWENITPDQKEKLKGFAREIGKRATEFHAKAFFWAESQIGALSPDDYLRRLLADFTTLTSEFANQVSSRTAVLYKQYDRQISGHALAVSDHLRDTSPTEFLHLYNWYNATLPDSDAGSGLSPADRVRVAQRLFSDHYWTKINEVHASGQGSFGTALVKDDIGNWNLKSFDNDPSELLDAYHKMARAGIKAAIDLAQTASTAGASEALGVANKFLQGRAGSRSTVLANDVRLESLGEQSVAELTKLQQKADKQVPDLRRAVEEAQTRADTAKAEAERTRKSYDEVLQKVREHEEEIITVQSEILEHRNTLQTADKRWQEIANVLKTLDMTDPSRDARVRELGALEEQQNQQRDKIRAAEQRLQKARSDLEGAKTAELAVLKSWKSAEEERLKTQFDLETKEQELRTFVTETMREARKILEVHRRVIDALKERQVKTQ